MTRSSPRKYSNRVARHLPASTRLVNDIGVPRFRVQCSLHYGVPPGPIVPSQSNVRIR